MAVMRLLTSMPNRVRKFGSEVGDFAVSGELDCSMAFERCRVRQRGGSHSPCPRQQLAAILKQETDQKLFFVFSKSDISPPTARNRSRRCRHRGSCESFTAMANDRDLSSRECRFPRTEPVARNPVLPGTCHENGLAWQSLNCRPWAIAHRSSNSRLQAGGVDHGRHLHRNEHALGVFTCALSKLMLPPARRPSISFVPHDVCIHRGETLVQPAAPESQAKSVIGNGAEARREYRPRQK